MLIPSRHHETYTQTSRSKSKRIGEKLQCFKNLAYQIRNKKYPKINEIPEL